MKYAKIFWLALLACIVSGVLGFIFWLVVIFGMVGSLGAQEAVVVESNSILKISLDEVFTESPSNNPLASLDMTTFEMKPTLTLLTALTAIEAAAEDDRIEAIYLSPSITSIVPLAALEEIRDALIEFKKSGKSVIAYNDTYTQSGYYLSTAADKIYVQPEGMVMWQGMATNTMFYKNLLDKLDITVDVFRPTVCRYKSAVEPYILDKMSPANRAQMEQLMGSMWSTIATDVADARSLTLAQVNAAADNLVCVDVEGALKAKMVDGLIYEDQLPELFRKAGADIDDDDDDISYINFGDYASIMGFNPQKVGADKVAIIYAEGSIVDGEGVDAKVYGDSMVELIRNARYDDDIKAVVLRVNSPGGSALASDVMWRELELLREEKPLVVSMGSYAASGGYYISAPADVIIANKLTLTGSIGVFGMIPNVKNALENKIGITFDGVETNSSADFLTSLNGMSQFEKQVMLKSVDKVYERFTSIVSEGRNLPIDDVLEIAQGRVWSGTEAVELGLADNIGGLRDAISIAVAKANLKDFRIVEVTPEAVGFAALFSGSTAKVKTMLQESMDPLYKEYSAIRTALEPLNAKNGLLMYSPYCVEL